MTINLFNEQRSATTAHIDSRQLCQSRSFGYRIALLGSGFDLDCLILVNVDASKTAQLQLKSLFHLTTTP